MALVSTAALAVEAFEAAGSCLEGCLAEDGMAHVVGELFFDHLVEFLVKWALPRRTLGIQTVEVAQKDKVHDDFLGTDYDVPFSRDNMGCDVLNLAWENFGDPDNEVKEESEPQCKDHKDEKDVETDLYLAVDLPEEAILPVHVLLNQRLRYGFSIKRM